MIIQFPGSRTAAPVADADATDVDVPLPPEEELAAHYADVAPLTWLVPLSARWAYQRGLVVDYHKAAAPGVAHRLLDVVQLGERVLEEWPVVALEVFTLLYAAPRDVNLQDQPPPDWCAALWNYLDASDEWHQLRDTCRARRALAIEVAASVLRALFYSVLGLNQLPKDAEAVPLPIVPADDAPEDADAEAARLKQEARRAAVARKLVRGTDHEKLLYQWLVAILAQATSAAAADQLLREVLEGIAGGGPGGTGYMPGGGVDPVEDAIDMDLVRQIQAMPDLAGILEIVGRMQRASRSEPLPSVIRTIPVDVQAGRHLPDLTQTEHILREEAPDLWARRYLDGETLQTARVGEEELAAGDLIVLVDHSGSMHGEPWRWANGLAAALSLEALKQGRRCVVARYSDIRNYRDQVVLALADVKPALQVLSLVPDGGTDTALALRKAAERLKAPLREPDIVLITDGGWPPLDDVTKAALKGPDGRGRLFVLLLEPFGEQRNVDGATQTWVIPQLTLDVAASVLKTIRNPSSTSLPGSDQ